MVRDAATQRPLEAVQVYIGGTGIGALTNSAGRFLLLNVPAGEVTLVAELVGYKSASQTATVTAGQSTVVNFNLQQTAIQLDQIVVTGTGVATQKKTLGNTISTIDASSLENAPISDFSQMISGREPGLVGLPSSGMTGEGARIRIRGSASLSQSNEPIIYVDGIRVDNSGGFGPGVSAGGQGSPSKLDDIDPNSIERIEVLKGAAAATLYGTEASNGVIQIFTKRGRQGAPRWTAQVDQAAIRVPSNRFLDFGDFIVGDNDPKKLPWDPDPAQQRANMQASYGVSPQPYEVVTRDLISQAFNTGYGQTYSLSVSGGGDLITYFVSGRWFHENGPFALTTLSGPNGARDISERRQATTNINVFPFQDLRIRFSALYSELDHQTPSNSNNIFGSFSSLLMGQLRWANPDNNRFGQAIFATTRENMQEDLKTHDEHFSGSINVNWRVTEGVALDGTFGVDVTNQQSHDFFPFGWNVDNFTSFFTDGLRDITDRNHRQLTGDFKASWETAFGEDISSQFLVGGQGFIEQTVSSGGEGTKFPGPGLEVVGAASDQSIFENFLKEVNAGVYGQEQLGWKDWAYLTLGARLDANSAFGENFTAQFYPKASVSLVVSDLDSWNSETLSTLRFRGAVGQSGLQPGAFDKFTTFSPLPSIEGPGVQPANLGNPNLKPEVSTEWEAGAEMGFLNDRFGLDATYWRRTVTDALVARQFPVTGGFTRTQLDNIGEMKAWGVELNLNGALIQRENFSLNAFANGAYITEEVTDMGGAPPLKTGGSYPRYRNFLKQGFAPGAYFGAKVADVPIPLDINGDCSVPTEAEALAYFSQPTNPGAFEVLPVNCGGDFLGSFLGKPTPDWQGSFGFNASFGNFDLNTLFEYKARNFQVQDLSGAFRQANAVIGRNTVPSAEVDATLRNPNSSAQDRLNAAVRWARTLRALAPMSGMNQIHSADFLRWRELSLSYKVPSDRLESLNINSLTLTAGARNLYLWVNGDYTGMDPEVNVVGRCNGGLNCNFLQSTEGWGIPIPRRFTFSARVGF